MECVTVGRSERKVRAEKTKTKTTVTRANLAPDTGMPRGEQQTKTSVDTAVIYNDR